ncbi:MAG: hypothetical protein CL609_18365 [Anaerolineaceae bacterium]|nr:hypothetical protein [Anaerolineaceae bacterium]
MFRKIIIASLIGCMLVVGAASSVYAQEENPPVCAPETTLLDTLEMSLDEVKSALAEGKTIQDLFEEAGLDYEAYLQQLAETQLDCINQALADGKITETQAERMISAVEKGLEEGKPFLLGHRSFKHPGIQKLRFLSFDNIAESLGLTAAELKTAMNNGQSLPEIAAEQNVDLDELFADWVEAQIADLSQAVEDEKLTQAQADALIEKMNQILEEGFDFENWNPFEHKGLDREKVILNSTKDLITQTMDALGMTVQDLRTALQDGKTLDEIAEEAGVDLDVIYQDWITEQMETVQTALEDGKITKAQADQIMERLENQLDNGFPLDFLQKVRQEKQPFGFDQKDGQRPDRGNFFPFHGKGN